MSFIQSHSIVSTVVEVVLKYILGHPTISLNFLFDIFQRIPFFRTLPGLYEVLDYRTELELLDTKGQRAIFRKVQKVRFLQNNVIAYYDRAWGDGNIFAKYKCSPGVEADRFQDGYRYNILISLRKTKHRGDKAKINIERHVEDGFTNTEESFQTDVDHRTRKMTVYVTFPKSRLPSKIALIQQNKRKTIELDDNHYVILSDGRVRYSWQSDNPALFDSYIIRWNW